MKRLHGFTMVEMLGVLAVITILALMAVPSFLDKVIKAQIEGALPLADIAKRPIAAIWAASQELPPDNAAAGLPEAAKIVNNYVTAVTVANGVIHVTFGNRASKAIAGRVLSLRPAVVEDAPVVPVTWVCGRAEAPEKMTIMGENRTDIDPSYLPLECRALKQGG